ncbi:MAG: class I SAM-dependent rRNA methyltransferase [Erysipelotrichaceae bacterium]|nr:class I SAM-dependent rRNA methyltransferase [Erysipelotrichaceae bacterium]
MNKQVVINKIGEGFLLKGQNWMYRNNLVMMDEDIVNGEEVDVVGEEGNYIGNGFVSLQSHVVVRLYSRKKEVLDEAFFRKKIISAYKFRKSVEKDNLSNCRLIFGEADGLGGLTVDRYNEVLVTQISSYGIEIRKEMIYKLLLEIIEGSKTIYERNDIAIRSKEGLAQYKGFYGDAVATKTVINENGLLLNVDIENGQKTGYFLDQKSNRVIVRHLAKDKKVCDCFSHTGGFALNAALGGAIKVASVDVSKTALDQGYANAKLNGLEDKIEFVQADVFDYLDELKPDEFDMIILDPPAFTKSRRTVDHAYNGYKRINKRAMDLLRDEGYLVTCSCSRYMETDLFEKMLREAASEVGVTLKQVSVTQQNSDHPILWTMEETSYLKFFVFQVVEV